MATHDSILAWEIPWTERILVGYIPCGCKRPRHDSETKTTTTNLFVINNLNKLLYCKNIYIYFGRIFQGIKVFLKIMLHLSPDIYKTICYNNIYQQINM